MNKNLKLFGSRLKETIEEKGKTIEEISKATKIRKVFIKSLLEGDRENLPDEIFVLGYIKAILNFLKVEPDSFLEEYKVLVKSKENFEEKKKEDFSPLPSLKTKSHFLMLSLMSIVILLFSAFFIFRTSILEIGSNLFSEKIVVQNKELKSPKITTTDSTISAEVQENIQNKSSLETTRKEAFEGLTLISVSNCWVELYGENNKILLRRELSGGEELNFNGNQFRITIGDPFALKLFFAGREITFPKEKGKVLRNFSIQGESK